MPSQTFNFLGMNFNTITMLVSPSPHRLQRLHELLRALQANLIPVRSLTPCWAPWSFFSPTWFLWAAPANVLSEGPEVKVVSVQGRVGCSHHPWLLAPGEHSGLDNLIHHLRGSSNSPHTAGSVAYKHASNRGWEAYMGPLHAQGLGILTMLTGTSMPWRWRQLGPRQFRIRAHKVRSIATSVAFQYSLSLKDVLEATYWCSVRRSSIHPRAQEVRSIATSVAFHYSLPSRMSLRLRFENPFINFYLRDFRAKRADGTKGISFVAASVPVTFPRPARSGH
ncbi:hypothetical protein ACOMHN_061227 [Nucella lapillus]